MSDTAIQLQRGMHLYRQGALDDAGFAFEAVLGKDPDCADAWHALGMIAIVRRDHDRALDCLSKALTHDTGNARIHQHVAVVHARLGSFDIAQRHYREAIRLDPAYAEAYFNLSRIVRFESGDPLIESIEAHLETNALSDSDRCFLHFAAGKYYDDIENPDVAFNHYSRANAARKARYDHAATERELQSIRTVFSAEWLRKHAGRGSTSRLPVFIVGMPRSGTSLVEQILAAHPEVTTGGELHDLWQIARALSLRDPLQRPFPECLAGGQENGVDEYANAYLEKLAGLGPSALRVTNKNPTDFRYLGLIARMFPNATVLHVRRDPRDVCLSCYFQNFRNGQEYSFDLQDTARFYRYYEDLMQHWQLSLPVQPFTVTYESLASDPEPVVRDILAFCGLDWHPDCIEPQKATGAVATASRWQVRRPINTGALRRWKRYEAHLGPLLEILGPIADQNEAVHERK